MPGAACCVPQRQRDPRPFASVGRPMMGCQGTIVPLHTVYVSSPSPWTAHYTDTRWQSKRRTRCRKSPRSVSAGVWRGWQKTTFYTKRTLYYKGLFYVQRPLILRVHLMYRGSSYVPYISTEPYTIRVHLMYCT